MYFRENLLLNIITIFIFERMVRFQSILHIYLNIYDSQGFADGSDSKEFTFNVGELGLIPGLGISPGGW